MKKLYWTSFPLLLFALILIGLSRPVLAAPVAQFTPFPTPTPGPDGQIIYIAQEGDSAWRIAAIFNLSLDQLRVLNHWGENPIINPGDKIVLGYAGPAEAQPTPGPSPTTPSLLPTPSAPPGVGNLCVILYNDLNGDSLRQEEEPAIPKGAISVSNRSGTVSKTAETVPGLAPVCFENLPEGDYTISVAVPEGYNPTTVMNLTLGLNSGDITYLPFGAQANTQTLATAPTAPEGGGGRSPLLAIVGGVLLLLGLGLGLVAAGFVKFGGKKKASSPSYPNNSSQRG